MDYLFFGHGKVIENQYWKRVVTLQLGQLNLASLLGR